MVRLISLSSLTKETQALIKKELIAESKKSSLVDELAAELYEEYIKNGQKAAEQLYEKQVKDNRLVLWVAHALARKFSDLRKTKTSPHTAATTQEETFKPTNEMAKNAAKGLEWRKKYGRGGTAVGVHRAAQLKNRENLSLETVKRMHSFFSRHYNNRAKHYDFQDNEPTAWRVAWELWGGDAGRDWAKRITDRFRD